MMTVGALRQDERAEGHVVRERTTEAPGERMADMHLARFLLRPLDFLDAAHWQALALPTPVISNMNQTPPFRRAANGALSEITFGSIEIDAESLTSMRTTREGRLCALLLVAPIASVDRIARLLGAAAISRRVTQLLLAADRKNARSEMGDEAFDFAVTEAPLMCPDLAGLGRAVPDAPFAAVARALLVRLVEQIVPAFDGLLRLRFPPFEQLTTLPRLSPAHLSQAIRLILRKEPAWLAFID